MLRIFTHPLSALQKVKESVLGAFQRGSLGQRWRDYSAQEQTDKGLRIFQEMQSELLKSPLWTFDAFRLYNVKLYSLYGGNEGKAKPTAKKNELPEDYAERVAKWEEEVAKKQDPSVRALRQKIQILDAMNSVELASNHKSIFTLAAKKLIAQRAKVARKEVDALLLEHDGLRADRKWYQTRLAMKLPLPASMEQRERLSTLDRPFSRSEMEMAKRHSEERSKSAIRSQKSPKRITGYVFRRNSRGTSRWSL